MGTTYNISYRPGPSSIAKDAIDSILVEINLSLSTYIDSSTISKVNNADQYGEKVTLLENGKEKSFEKITLARDEHFILNYNKAEQIFLESDGAFDPTVMPFVNYWGFGYDPKKPRTDSDKSKVNLMLKYVGLEKFNLEANDNAMVIIKPVNAEIDFSAIAKGYAVDYISNYLTENEVTNSMVEIGGEVYAKGLNKQGLPWKIGLNTPKETAALNDYSSVINLDGRGLASSGNYRNFHVVDGKKYGHEINPKTGYPEKNNLLAVSVLAPTCMEADAVATALMIMGHEKARVYIDDYQQLEACYFTSDEKGNIIQSMSKNFHEALIAN